MSKLFSYLTEQNNVGQSFWSLTDMFVTLVQNCPNFSLFCFVWKKGFLSPKRGSRGVAHVAITPRWSVK